MKERDIASSDLYRLLTLRASQGIDLGIVHFFRYSFCAGEPLLKREVRQMALHG